MHHPTQPLHDRRPLLFPSCTLVKLPDSTLTDKNGPSGPSTGKPRLPGRRNVKRYMASNAELCYLAPVMARRQIITLGNSHHFSLITLVSCLCIAHTRPHIYACFGGAWHTPSRRRCSACTRVHTGYPVWVGASVSSRDHPQHVVI
jgi:hypothetical protein